jgi:hypothetical protein
MRAFPLLELRCMKTEKRTTDSHGRIKLPKSFANSAVIIEYVSATEIRIHKAQVIAQDDLAFGGETPLVVSDQEWDHFLDFLDNPPQPNDSLRQIAATHARNGA